MPRTRRPAIAIAALAAALCAALCAGGPAQARDGGGDGGDRVEVRVQGVCGTSSRAELRLRADGEEIRVDARVRTSKRGVWRVSVFHERRLAVRARVRVTRGEARLRVPRLPLRLRGPRRVRFRAVAPSGETCAAAATAAGS